MDVVSISVSFMSWQRCYKALQIGCGMGVGEGNQIDDCQLMVLVYMCISMCGQCMVGKEGQQCIVAAARVWCRQRCGFYGSVECIVQL